MDLFRHQVISAFIHFTCGPVYALLYCLSPNDSMLAGLHCMYQTSFVETTCSQTSLELHLMLFMVYINEIVNGSHSVSRPISDYLCRQLFIFIFNYLILYICNAVCICPDKQEPKLTISYSFLTSLIQFCHLSLILPVPKIYCH